jgi:hypothetical protein
MIDRAGHVTARLKSEYRGVLVYDKHVWDEVFERKCSVDDIFGVFEVRKGSGEMAQQVLSAVEDFGLICEFDPAALSQLISTGNSTG